MIVFFTVQPVGSPQTSVEKVQCQRDCLIESDDDNEFADNDNEFDDDEVSEDDDELSANDKFFITK